MHKVGDRSNLWNMNKLAMELVTEKKELDTANNNNKLHSQDGLISLFNNSSYDSFDRKITAEDTDAGCLDDSFKDGFILYSTRLKIKFGLKIFLLANP